MGLASASQDEALIARVKELAASQIADAFKLTSKQERTQRLNEIRKAVRNAVSEGVEIPPSDNELKNILFDIEAEVVRSRILNGEPRIDGRDTRTVRPIDIRVGVLPRTHGSALFTRGETQAIVVTTLGTGRDEQIIDALAGEYRDRFLLHYNFPAVLDRRGGAFRFAQASRDRSWASCQALAGGCAAGPAGFLVHHPCGLRDHRIERLQLDGIGVRRFAGDDGCGRAAQERRCRYRHGLDQDGGRFAVLTDILGDEDHLGDMDFKVAGTEDG